MPTPSESSTVDGNSSLAHKAATALLEAIGSTLWGFKPNLMQHFVAQHGPWNYVVWFASNMPRYESILRRWGPLRTHLLATAISTLNACPYCTYGHSKAFQLHYLKEKGMLFSMDEDAMFNCHTLGPATVVVDHYVEALLENNLLGEVKPLRRMLELYTEDAAAVTQSSDKANGDDDLLHLIQMFAALNVCGIQSNAVVDEIHDPINRNTELRKEYAELRGAHS